ncbi:MAG TPA: AAA family ATPase [Steroidobacteraceae bacterium]|jgi:MoxR-like ATPase
MLQVSERTDDRVLHGGPLPRERLIATVDQLNRVILGKDAEIRLCVACLLARGHLLIEDIPGVGKTTLAHALAQTLGLSYQRIQFTSDLLPADIIGVSIFDRAGSRFEFQHGPIFAQLVLADEVNRATPKAQSALLEAMEEQQVTVDGRSHPLPEPFFVIATQNPSEQVGTFPLPESQLDRFLMRTELGYPDAAHERQLLMGQDRRALLATLGATLSAADLALLQAGVHKIHASPALLDYVQALVACTRSSGRFLIGLSPRAAIGLLRASQSWALLAGRNAVLPEDVQAVLPAVVGHRLRVAGDSGSAQDVGREIIESVPIP